MLTSNLGKLVMMFDSLLVPQAEQAEGTDNRKSWDTLRYLVVQQVG